MLKIHNNAEGGCTTAPTGKHATTTEVRLDGLKCGRSCRCGGGIFRGWKVGDARPSTLAPNRSYPLPPLFPLFPIMILTKTRISLGLPSKPRISLGLGSQGRISLGLGSPNPTYPLAWDSQTPHIPWLGIPKTRISLGLGFPKPAYPLAPLFPLFPIFVFRANRDSFPPR